jgi:hypothetical protein
MITVQVPVGDLQDRRTLGRLFLSCREDSKKGDLEIHNSTQGLKAHTVSEKITSTSILLFLTVSSLLLLGDYLAPYAIVIHLRARRCMHLFCSWRSRIGHQTTLGIECNQLFSLRFFTMYGKLAQESRTSRRLLLAVYFICRLR